MVDSIVSTSGTGKITIRQGEGIGNLIGKINPSNEPVKPKTVSRKGYRIQAYSGSQQIAKTEAYHRESKIRARFPEYATYVTLNSPFWRLRIGDFTDQFDAEEALRTLKKAFPEYMTELYIMPDNVKSQSIDY
jgi:hypothetical protein